MSVSEMDYEGVLRSTIDAAGGECCPPRLAAALEHAVFPGGARVRPKLCLAVALANDCDAPSLAAAAAAAVELLHCASLVHDDLPCFDNADERRGRPSVHALYGEQLGVGSPCGIAAGQAWESEPMVDVACYHRAKTGALFIAATAAGAAAAGADTVPWARLGEAIGAAYQVADDIQDATASSEEIGKPTGVDAHLDRPSIVAELGLQGATRRLQALVEASIEAVPACRGRDELQMLVRQQSKRFIPKACAVAA